LKRAKTLRLAEPKASDRSEALRVLQGMLSDADREQFVAVFLDGHHNVTGAHVVAIGGQHGIGTIEARTVFRAAISACASAIIVGHNHPSGDPTPSAEDIACTRALVEAGKVLGIPILDHLIVTRDVNRWRSIPT